MNGAEPAEILDEGQQRIAQILARTSMQIEAVLDEIENATGHRPGPAFSGRSGILDDGWGMLRHHRAQCLSLLEAIGLLEPLMGPGRGGRRASTVEAALKVAAPDVAERIVQALEGAGLVSVEETTTPE